MIEALNLIATHAGGEQAYHEWHARLASVTQRYSKVVFLGDSMGASGALLFSDLATAVQAFSPQVSLIKWPLVSFVGVGIDSGMLLARLCLIANLAKGGSKRWDKHILHIHDRSNGSMVRFPAAYTVATRMQHFIHVSFGDLDDLWTSSVLARGHPSGEENTSSCPVVQDVVPLHT